MKEKVFRCCAMLMIPLMTLLNCPLSSLADEAKPVEMRIKHKQVEQVTAGERVPLKVSIADKSGIEVVRAYFKAADAAEYSFVVLESDGSDDLSDLLPPYGAEKFIGTLPAPASGTESFDYLILAKNNDNQVVKTQTYRVAVQDSDSEQAVAAREQLNVYTELQEAPAEITGFSDNIAIDVVESTAKLGVVAGIYSAASAGTSSGGAIAGGTIAASSGLSTTAIVVGAAVATAAVGGAAVAAGGGSSSGSSSGATGTCNSSTKSGSNQAETHKITLGKSSGTFGFSWYNGDIYPDRIIVSVGGRTLLNTGCVTGEGSRILQFSGGSIATVQVQPNCNGISNSTHWEFTVRCP